MTNQEKDVREVVTEYRSLLGDLLDETSFGEYLSSFHHVKIEKWLTQILTQRDEAVRREERERIALLAHGRTMWADECLGKQVILRSALIDAILTTDQDKAHQELINLSEEYGLYGTPTDLPDNH